MNVGNRLVRAKSLGAGQGEPILHRRWQYGAGNILYDWEETGAPTTKETANNCAVLYGKYIIISVDYRLSSEFGNL
jgi:hypothetical protein